MRKPCGTGKIFQDNSRKNMHIAIDAVGIRGHGGAAVLSELLHWLPRVRPEWRWHVFLFERDLREFDDPVVGDHVKIEHTRYGDSGWARLRWINSELQKRVQAIGADVIFSFANIGFDRPSRPQVVFVQQSNAFFDEGIPSWDILRWARMRFMRQQILRGARSSHAVIVQIEAMRSRMREIAPYLDGKICVIPSGYRTPSANPVIRSGKKAMIDGASRPRLIYVSHPSEHKNHVALVQALARIIKDFPSANLLLTLERKYPPNARYTAFVEEICQIAEQAGVEKQLLWLGILGSDEVANALASSDLMVFPSLAESFGLGIVEAMAMGCPIAAADLPYAHDVAGEAAIYFEPRNAESIAESIVAILNDDEGLMRLKSAGAKRKMRFSYERIAGEVARVLEDANEKRVSR